MNSTVSASLIGYLAVARACLANTRLPTTLNMRTNKDVIRMSCRPVATKSELENVTDLPRGFDCPVLINLNVAALVLLGGVVDQVHDDPYAEQQEP
jgi:hypothetical protein